MMTSDEYYNRKRTEDYLEEEMRTMKGCRTFFFILLGLLAVAIAAAIWL